MGKDRLCGVILNPKDVFRATKHKRPQPHSFTVAGSVDKEEEKKKEAKTKTNSSGGGDRDCRRQI